MNRIVDVQGCDATKEEERIEVDNKKYICKLF
jgi:hypothetical protein